MRLVREGNAALRSMPDLEMACKPIPGEGCAFAEIADIPELWSPDGR
jgi:hypothetical protein